MAISDYTRKVLWARSGNGCAVCKQALVAAATDTDREAVVGDECHIVSGSPGGPRYDAAFPAEEVDAYENLILLCKVHHKQVDDQPVEFDAARLRALRRRHEEWVAAVTAPLERPGADRASAPEIPLPDTIEIKVGVLWSCRSDIPEHHEVVRFQGVLLAESRREDANGPTWSALYRLQRDKYIIHYQRNWRGDYEESFLARPADDEERVTLSLEEVQREHGSLASRAGLPRVRLIE